jgi:hypothetical protein
LSSNLIVKIEDYSKYVVLAVKYFKEGSYPDSAINCRKAAEAACKIVVYYKYNQKLADTKLEGKSLKELIVLLIHEGLSERKAINTLETLQIIGNKAAHDNFIAKEETSYAIHALNLFTEYLFKEYLKISIPKDLDAIFREAEKEKPKKPEVVEKIIVQEKFNKEAEDQIFNKIKGIEEKSEGDATKLEELKQELLVSRKIIEELAQQKQVEGIQPVTPQKSNIFSRKNILIFTLAFFALITVVFYLRKNKTEEKQNTDTAQIKKHPDSIYVAINKIQVLQDNPNMDFKIEQLIYNRVNNLIIANNLPISLIAT